MADEYIFFNKYGNCWHNIPDHVKEALDNAGKIISVEADKCSMLEARLLWSELTAYLDVSGSEYMLRRQMETRKAESEVRKAERGR